MQCEIRKFFYNFVFFFQVCWKLRLDISSIREREKNKKKDRSIFFFYYTPSILFRIRALIQLGNLRKSRLRRRGRGEEMVRLIT